MARRRRVRNELEFAEAIFGLIALSVFLSIFSPAVRQAIRDIAVGFLILLALVVVIGIGVLIYRLNAKRRELEEETVPLKVYNMHTMEAEPMLSPPAKLTSVSLKGWIPESHLEEPSKRTPLPDILEQLRAIDWFQFEKIVALTYGKLGYLVTHKGGANPDGGIDLLISKDGVTTAIQCKQWKTWNVGVKAVREFLGALTDAGVQNGIFITLRGYTGEAKSLADKHRIEIVNETGLAKMLEITDARFDPETLELLNDKRKFCPRCGREMVLRTATKGIGVGQQFWGCAGYPKCRYIVRS